MTVMRISLNFYCFVVVGLFWSRCNYLVLLDTSLLPAEERCELRLASMLSAKIWKTRKVISTVILALCPWQLVVHTPLEDAAVEDRYRVVQAGNISDLTEVLEGQFKNFNDKTWPISIYPS